MNSDLKNRIEELIFRLNEINTSDIDASTFIEFLKILRKEASELSNLSKDDEIRHQLEDLGNYKEFDQLNWMSRFLRKLAISKFRLDHFNNWKTCGKYLSDLHSIELTLKGINYKLGN